MDQQGCVAQVLSRGCVWPWLLVLRGMRNYRNTPETHEYARANRQNLNLPEVMLWQRLRRNQLGVRIRRQVPIGPYIADYVCVTHRLVIELDGWSHDLQDPDQLREWFIRGRGFEIVRFTNEEVYDYLDGVVFVIGWILGNGEVPEDYRLALIDPTRQKRGR